MSQKIADAKQNGRNWHRVHAKQHGPLCNPSGSGVARALGALILAFAFVHPAEVMASGLVHRRGFPLTTPLPGTFAADDGVAFIGCAGTLLIFDLESREELARVYTDGRIEQIEVVLARLYVADGIGGLLVYDVSHPANPVLVETWDPKGSKRVRGVAVSGAYAYLQVERSVYTMRLSGLKHVSTYELPADADFSFGGMEATAGAVVFACSHESDPFDVRLAILDIRASPSNPTFVGAWDTPGRLSQMFADGTADKVFVACSSVGMSAAGFDGLQVVDLTDPSAPMGSAASIGGDRVNASMCLSTGLSPT